MTENKSAPKSLFEGSVSVTDGVVDLKDPSVLKSPQLDALVHQAVFAKEADRHNARWLLWELGQIVGDQTGINTRTLHGSW